MAIRNILLVFSALMVLMHSCQTPSAPARDEIFKKEKDNSLTFNVDVENQEPTVTIIYKVDL